MKPHEERVIIEQKELQLKIDNLKSFLSKERPDFVCKYQWNLLGDQLGFMEKYNDILKDRIDIFSTPSEK